MQFKIGFIGKTLLAGFLMVGLVACPPAPAPVPDFSLSLDNSSLTVKRTQSGTLAVSLTKTGGFANSVALSLEGAPTGVTSSFNPVSTSSTSTLTVNVAANAALGETTLTIKGISGSLTKTIPFKLTVTAAPVTGDTTPPTVVSTTAASNTSVTVVFSEAIAGGNLATNFSFPSQGLTVSAASVAADNKTVTLTTSAQSAISYALLVSSSLTDLAGNAYTLTLQNTILTTFQGTNSSITSVTASSDMPIVSGGTQANLSAVVVGTGTFSNAVTWSITSGVGSLSATTGSPVVFSIPATAPNGTTVIRATSNQDASKFGEVSLSITAATPGVTAVTISAPATTVLPATNTTLTATVTGNGTFSNAVTWSIVTTDNAILINPTGSSITFSVPGADARERTVEIKATSTGDSSKFGTITMTIKPASITGVTLTAAKSALKTGESTQLSATVTSSGNVNQFNPNSTWKIENDGIGTLSSGNGSLQNTGFGTTNTYSAPNTSVGRIVRITASSVQDPTQKKTIFISINPNQASISGGQHHTLALKSDNTVLAWGQGAFGQLGTSNLNNSPTPVAVSGAKNTNIVAVSAGGFYSLALKTDGSLISWGDNTHGQLGNNLQGSINSTSVPVDVGVTFKFTSIATGTNHSLALRDDGNVYSWGDNRDKQLGNTAPNNTTPTLVPGTSNTVAIAAGEKHSLALKSDGTILAWGSDDFGQLGDNAAGGVSSTTPVPVQDATNIVAIAAGRSFSLALKSDGTLLAWGANFSGELGDGSSTDRTTPVAVGGSNSNNIVAIAAGLNHSVALKKDGTVLTWGSDEKGQLGDGTPLADKSTPTVVGGATNIVAIAAGGLHSLALKSDGKMFSWGDDTEGQLGNGVTTGDQLTPIDVILGALTIRLP